MVARPSLALDGFFTNVEQADAGLLVALEHRVQRRTHDGKLQQVLRSAVHVGAQVQHGGRAAPDIGHLAGNGRPVDAVERLEYIAGNRHQRARVACRHGRLGGAVLDLLYGHAHGRVFLAPQCHFHGVVHGHHLAGRHQGGALVNKALQRLRQSHQQQACFRVLLQKGAAGRQRDSGAVVTPHAIHSQSNHGQRSTAACTAWA